MGLVSCEVKSKLILIGKQLVQQIKQIKKEVRGDDRVQTGDAEPRPIRGRGGGEINLSLGSEGSEDQRIRKKKNSEDQKKEDRNAKKFGTAGALHVGPAGRRIIKYRHKTKQYYKLL